MKPWRRGREQVPREAYDAEASADGQDMAWWQVEALTTLKLAHNAIEELPAGLESLADLQVLDVSSNRVTTLPQALGGLPSLKSLDLSQNRRAPCITSINSTACRDLCMRPGHQPRLPPAKPPEDQAVAHAAWPRHFTLLQVAVFSMEGHGVHGVHSA
jgi:Leucine rich repeat